VAREWFAKYSANWAENHSNRINRHFDRDILLWIAGRPIAEITRHAKGKAGETRNAPPVARTRADPTDRPGSRLQLSG